jgi:hypothetical protein
MRLSSESSYPKTNTMYCDKSKRMRSKFKATRAKASACPLVSRTMKRASVSLGRTMAAEPSGRYASRCYRSNFLDQRFPASPCRNDVFYCRYITKTLEVPLTIAGGASANAPAVEVPSQSSGPRILLAEEEVFDVSLSTFYVFDKEGQFGPGADHCARSHQGVFRGESQGVTEGIRGIFR